MPLSVQSLSRDALLDAADGVLLASATLAQDRVRRAWPFANTITDPILTVAVPIERKESATARGQSPGFTTTFHLVVTGKVTGKGLTSAEIAASAQTQMDALRWQVEDAILSAPSILSIVEQVTSVEVQSELNPEGKGVIGAFSIVFQCEAWQQFLPVPGPVLTEADSTVDFAGPPGLKIKSVTPP